MKFSYAEGATPIDDISGLIPSWVKTQSVSQGLEVLIPELANRFEP